MRSSADRSLEGWGSGTDITCSHCPSGAGGSAWVEQTALALFNLDLLPRSCHIDVIAFIPGLLVFNWQWEVSLLRYFTNSHGSVRNLGGTQLSR